MNTTKTYLTLLFTGLLAVAVLLTGCDALSGSGTDSRMVVRMQDNPDDIAEAWVTIERLELVGDDGVVLLSDEVQDYDLLTLQDGITATLADTPVPSGTYSQLRIVVAEASEVLLEDEETLVTLKVPSGTETGIKVLLSEFEISSDADLVEVLIDFDVAASFVKAGASGQYIFKPVIKPLSLEVNGIQEDLSEGEGNGDEDGDA
jgi:predicted small secreted protein